MIPHLGDQSASANLRHDKQLAVSVEEMVVDIERLAT